MIRHARRNLPPGAATPPTATTTPLPATSSVPGRERIPGRRLSPVSARRSPKRRRAPPRSISSSPIPSPASRRSCSCSFMARSCWGFSAKGRETRWPARSRRTSGIKPGAASFTPLGPRARRPLSLPAGRGQFLRMATSFYFQGHEARRADCPAQSALAVFPGRLLTSVRSPTASFFRFMLVYKS